MILLLAWLPRPSTAQESDPPFMTVVFGALDSLSKDSAFRAVAGTRTKWEVFAMAKDDALGRLPNDQLADFLQVFVKSLAHADTAECAGMWKNGLAAGLEPLARHMSIEDAQGWGRWYVNMVWASVRHLPLAPMADTEEIGRWMLAKRAQLDEADRRRIIRAMSQDASEADSCWYPQFIYSRMVKPHSPADLRVARAIMFGAGRQ
jgi:hypothetical protein